MRKVVAGAFRNNSCATGDGSDDDWLRWEEKVSRAVLLDSKSLKARKTFVHRTASH
jgi:hypothetical protein